MTGEELNRELLKWAGFISLDNKTNCWQEWQFPDGSKHYAGDLPDFTDPVWGIAHCFKWLVPKLEGLQQIILQPDEDGRWYLGMTVEDELYENIGFYPAQALCNAIEKLVQVEG